MWEEHQRNDIEDDLKSNREMENIFMQELKTETVCDISTNWFPFSLEIEMKVDVIWLCKSLSATVDRHFKFLHLGEQKE